MQVRYASLLSFRVRKNIVHILMNATFEWGFDYHSSKAVLKTL